MTARRRRPARSRQRSRVAESSTQPYGARRLLLDTNAWLWWQADDRRLGPHARAAIQGAYEVFLSAASAWEMAIKSSLGKLRTPKEPSVSAQLARTGFSPLAIDVVHAEAVQALPALHRDPFDRLLIAQARVEGLTIVTSDAVFAKYGTGMILATE